MAEVPGHQLSTEHDESRDRPFRRHRLSAMSLGLLLFAVAAAATGQVLLKHGMTLATESAKKTDGALVVKAVTSPWIVIGLVVFAISAVAWLATLSRLPLSVAYPFNALGYLAILTASTLLLNERTNIWTWVGTACVATGLVIVVLTYPSQADRGTTNGQSVTDSGITSPV